MDGLRGVAALIVVLSHTMLVRPSYWNFRFGTPPSPPTAFDRFIFDTPMRILFAGGGNAVILFFVLSGFVLSLPWLAERNRSCPKFLIARICRLCIPYWVAMLIAAVMASSLGGRPIAGASDFVNNFGWVNRINIYSVPSTLLMLGNQFSTWIHSVTWTLVLEMRVSLIFPALVLLVILRGITGTALAAVSLAILYFAAVFLIKIFPNIVAWTDAPHRTFFYAAFFLAGTTLAKYREMIGRIGSSYGGSTGYLFFAVGLLIWWFQWPGYRELMAGVSAFLLIASALSSCAPRRWLSSPVPQWLGRVSYSLYLVHIPIILSAEYLFHEKVSPPLIAILAFPFTLFAAAMFYRAVEQPSHELARRLTRRRHIGSRRQPASG